MLCESSRAPANPAPGVQDSNAAHAARHFARRPRAADESPEARLPATANATAYAHSPPHLPGSPFRFADRVRTAERRFFAGAVTVFSASFGAS